jgi:hypothetical protein
MNNLLEDRVFLYGLITNTVPTNGDICELVPSRGAFWETDVTLVFCLAIKLGFISANKYTLPIKGTGLHKIPGWSTEYHYTTFRLVCGVLAVQLSLSDPSFSGTTNSLRYVADVLTPILNAYPITRDPMPFFQQCSEKAHTTNNAVRLVFLMK